MSHVSAPSVQRADRDRRRSSRVDLCVPIRWRSESGEGRTSALGDLARGGLFVRTTDALATGDSLSGVFLLPRDGNHLLVVFRGEVRWRAPVGAPSPLGPGVGVRFTNVRATSVPPNTIAARHGERREQSPQPYRSARIERLVAACRTPQARVTFLSG